MEGSDPPSPNIFGAGTEYKRLHTIARLIKPEVNLENEFAVAVLEHTQNSTNCSSGDFLWFKVKSVSIRRSRENSGLINHRNTPSPDLKVLTAREPTSRSISNSQTIQLVMLSK
jgi:hypothetical protein